jgi:hypothetical protein
MIFRKISWGLSLFFFTITCFSQTENLALRDTVSSDLLIGYNSSLIYPGIRAGIEFPVYSVCLKKNIDSVNSKIILKGRFISVNAGWYHQTNFHDNLYFTAEWTMRRTKENGFFTEFSSGFGYSRTFLGATTYEVDNNGDVDIIKSAGYKYAMIIAGGGLGYDFSNKKEVPISIFCKFDMMGMFPYNSTLYFRPAMELGIIYKPVNFIPFLIKTRVKTK